MFGAVARCRVMREEHETDRAKLVAWIERHLTHRGDDVDVAVVLLSQAEGLASRLGTQVAGAAVDAARDRLAAGGGPDAIAACTDPETVVVVRPVRVAGRPDGRARWGARLLGLLDRPVRVQGLDLRLTGHVATTGACGREWRAHEGETLLRQLEHRVLLGRIEQPDLLVHLPDLRRERCADALDRRLASAVRGGEVVARYQPIVDLRSGRIVGAEALACWDGSGAELAGPERFLALAAATGLMPAITERILRQACADFAGGVPEREGWWVSVNLDAPATVHPETPGQIEAVLRETGLAPERLCIEVSERLVPDPLAVRSLQAIADLGVQLAMDDFGSGWSSLAQLRSLPLTLVKLDRSLLVSCSVDEASVLLATVAFVASLGLDVLAEGIERPGDRLLVQAAGVALGQGFLWGAAQPLDQLVGAAAVVAGAAAPMPSGRGALRSG